MRRLKPVFLAMAMLSACISCGGGGGQAAAPATAAATSPSGANKIDDTDPAIIYSRGNKSTQDWNAIHSAPEDYQQDEHASNFVRSGGAVTGVGAVVNFSGTGITWIGKKSPKYGIASYSIDGGPAQTVDNYSATELDQNPLVTVSGLASQSHVLAISLLNQKNAAAVDYWQTIDAFEIDGSTLTATQGTSAGYNSPELVLTGHWGGGLVSDGSDLSGGHYWSNETNSSISWTFVGSLIEVFGRPDYENGYMDVYIDTNPNPVASINGHWGLSDDDSLNSHMLFATRLTPGQHTIKIVVAGKHDSSARDNYVQVDEFIAFQ